MKNKMTILAVLVFLFGTSLNAQDVASMELSPQRLAKKEARNALIAPQGAVVLSLGSASQPITNPLFDALMPDGAQPAVMSGPFLFIGGVCTDVSTNQPVSIYNCYYYSMEVDLALTECYTANAICYYDENWNLVDAYPVQCKPYCMN